MQSKRTAGRKQAKCPPEFVKAVRAGVKRGDHYVDICRTIEEKRVARLKSDL